MGRYGSAIFILLVGLFTWPFVKSFMDIFTNPTTGLMTTPGVGHIVCSADLIALATFVPWFLPIAALFIAVYRVVKPERDIDREPPRF